MPMDVRLRDYVFALNELLNPCEVTDSIWSDTKIVIIAKKRIDVEVFCPRCGLSSTPRGCAASRLIRHLNFNSIQVWIDITFPRVFCTEHGHIVAKQQFCDSRCRTSYALEDYLLNMICSSDVSESELMQSFGLRRSALSRMIVRSRMNHRVCSLRRRHSLTEVCS